MAKDLHLRHKKYEDPAYTLEPNIKEGEGGLRDFQIGRWLIRAKYKTDRWDSILFPDHSQVLEKSLQFLWTVRNQLHLMSGRRQDDLLFELQEKIALALGFPYGTKGIEELKMLYLLTFADINAVGPEAWTSWKNSLLMELFLKTSRFIERNASTGPSHKGNETIQKVQESLSPEIISEFAEYFSERYLSCYSPEEIAHHIEMARSLGKRLLLVEVEIEKETQAKVTLCTKDRYGLFSKITGSMFLSRLNILEAQIHTWGNGIALDTFWVEDATKDIDRRLRQFKKDLEEILDGKVSLRDLLSKKKESNGMKQKVIPRVSGEVKINNLDSDFYTIIEVTGKDRIGILYEMTDALTNSGCDIHFARVSTLGNRIVDVFYVQDEWGEKMEEKQKVDRIKQILLLQLTSNE